VRVTAAAGNVGTVAVGAGGAKSATFHQPDGTAVTVSLKGPGTATLSFSGAVTTTTSSKGVDVTGTFLDPDIAITGSTAATILTITSKGGGKIARIGDITTAGEFGTLSAKTTNLDGDLTAAASIKSITLNGANDGTITLGLGGQTLVFKTTTAMNDEQIHSGGVIRSITTPGWLGTNVQTSGLTALAVGSITVSGSVTNSAFKLTAAGTVNLATLKVTKDISGSTIDVVGNIGAISAGALFGDQIFAGVGTLGAGQVLPNFPTDFATVQSIKSVTVKNGSSATFANTNIAAELLGSISLGRILTANGGTTFGVAANKMTALSGTDNTSHKKFSLHKLDNPAALPALESKLGFSLQDFVIKLF
jgi:hypothetical protein